MTLAFALKFLPLVLPFAIKGLKVAIERGARRIPNKAIPWVSALLGAVIQAVATGTVDVDALSTGLTAGLAAVGVHVGTVHKASDPTLGGQSPARTP